MVKVLDSKNSFNGGELSPRLYGRSDLAKYKSGLKTCTNFVLQPHGPAIRRNGTKYIAEVKDSNNEVRLFRFQFNTNDAFILEFGDLYIRFYTEQGQVLSGGSPYEISTPYSSNILDEVQIAQFGDKVYIVHSQVEPRVLTRNTTDNWSLDPLDPYPEATVEIGELPDTTCTPGATTGVGVTFTSAANAFLAKDVGRQIINLDGNGRASITGFTSATQVTCDIVEDFDSTDPIPSTLWKLDLSPLNELTIASGEGKAGEIINITCTGDTFRTASDAGRYLLLHDGVCQIVTVNSATDIDCEVQRSLSSTDNTKNWTLEDPAWSPDRGYPRAVGFFEQRLIYGSTVTQPQTLWFSEIGIYDGFGIGSDDDASISVDLVSREVNEIQWIAPLRDLVVGTSGGELTITNGNGAVLAPSNIQQRPRTYYGSEIQQPAIIGNEVLFVQKSGKKLRSFLYNFDVDSYKADNLLFLSEHLPGDANIVDIAYAQEPDQLLYCVLSDGDMLVGTYDREQEVLGWSRYQTTGSYESVETIETSTGNEVWAVVKRSVNGSDVRYVELFQEGDGTDTLHIYSDSALTYSDPKTISNITQAIPARITCTGHGYSNGDEIKLINVGGMTEINNITYKVINSTANTFEITDLDDVNIDSTSYTAYASGGEAHALITSVSGLDHLEGETVQIKADGGSHTDKTVSSGSITLDDSFYEVVVGLEYTSTLRTLPKEYSIGFGTMQGQQTRRPRTLLRVNRSTKPLINGEFLPNRETSFDMDEAVPLFSGDLEYSNLGWDASEISITLSDPLPLQLLAIYEVIEGGSK